MTTRLFRKLIWLVLGALSVWGIAYGQGTSDPSKGTITVQVQDSTGGLVPGARVTLSGPEGEK